MFVFRCKDLKCVGATMARKNPEWAPKGAPRTRNGSPATSPGGHYAGCKWTEPPLPSALPPPPQHWMQAPRTHQLVALRQPKAKPEQPDLEAQLKVLLKVQA